MSLTLPRRFLFPLSGSAAALAVLLGAGPAAAQQITIGTGVKRSTPVRGGTYHPNWINHSDCVADGTITFPVSMPSPAYSNDTLEIWVGSNVDCSVYDNRKGASPTCWNVYAATPSSGTAFSAKVRMQDIAGQHKYTDTASGPGSGIPADCENQSNSSPLDATLYFMLVDGSGQIDATTQFGTYKDLKLDLRGPDAPTGIKTGIAENQVKVSWTAPSSPADLVGYHLFCFPKPGAASTSQPLEAGTDAALDAAGGGSGGADAATGTGGSGGTSGAGGSATSDAGSDAAAGNPDCPSPALLPGAVPDPAYLCGDVHGVTSTSAYAKGLTNFTKYAVAVAGYDGVQNDGPLSTIECGTPQPVNDFWDEYTQAGGKGGGGFCGIADKPAPGAGGAFLLALFAGLLRRRRRQRS